MVTSEECSATVVWSAPEYGAVVFADGYVASTDGKNAGARGDSFYETCPGMEVDCGMRAECASVDPDGYSMGWGKSSA